MAKLAIVLVSVAVAVAVALFSALGQEAGVGQAQPAGDAVFRELAERLLGGPGPSAPGGVTVELLPGALPAELGADLPMAPGSRLVGSVARRSAQGLVNAAVVVDSPGAPRDVVAFYREGLAARGWSAPQLPIGGSPGGFQPGPPFAPPEMSLFCQSEDGPMLFLRVGPLRADTSDVRLSMQRPAAPFGAGVSGPFVGGPCQARPEGPSRSPLGVQQLPRLSAPPGIQLLSNGGSFGPNMVASEAVALTDRSAPELEAAFAGQLADAGWTRTAGASGRPLAWSLWEVEGDPGGQGLLVVLETPGENRLALSLRVYRGGPFSTGPMTIVGGGSEVSVPGPFVPTGP